MGGRGYSLFLVPYFLLLSFGLVSLESFRFGFSSTNRQPCLNVRPGRITEAGQYKNQPWLPLPLIPSRATISVALECSDQQRYISSRFVFSYITNSNRHWSNIFFFAIFAHSLLRHSSKVYNSFAESPPFWTRRQVVEEKGSQSSAASSIIVLSHHEDQSLPSHSAARRFCRLADSHFRILGKSKTISAHVLFIWSQAADLVAGFIATHTERIASDITLWIASVVFL